MTCSYKNHKNHYFKYFHGGPTKMSSEVFDKNEALFISFFPKLDVAITAGSYQEIRPGNGEHTLLTF